MIANFAGGYTNICLSTIAMYVAMAALPDRLVPYAQLGLQGCPFDIQHEDVKHRPCCNQLFVYTPPRFVLLSGYISGIQLGRTGSDLPTVAVFSMSATSSVSLISK